MQGTTEGDWVFPSGFSKTNIPFIVRRMLLATCVCFHIYRAQPQNSFSYAHCSDSPSENQRSEQLVQSVLGRPAPIELSAMMECYMSALSNMLAASHM